MLRQLDTLIGQHTSFEGNLEFDGGLRVDGSVTGNISASHDENAVLTLSEVGKIEGDIRVPNMIINGAITGNLYATGHLEISENTQITGDVYYALLQMEEGAQINGNLIHVKESDPIMNIGQDGEQIMLANNQSDADKP